MSALDQPANGILRYRVEQIERRVDGLEEKIDALREQFTRFILVAVAATFTFAGAIILLALNLLVLRQ